ncbi:MAG: DUF134 domain-containing protein [Methanothrix sp.]|uniref:DUF134 domain-containing protein n=1 Tax=Methanothrix sp. TaxID=90426 RepID=UPI0025F93EB9|nr:DUF134 domain-containing protein [Methanothrix sp.]MCQ8903001.1 DUF134 domain-containing protein [Methanothrix sp.]
MCRCRGRRRGKRWISEIPEVRCFLPESGEGAAVVITLEELEAIRLVDLLDLEQEEAALYMGISRKAFWNDLVRARRKVAAALVYGMGIRIEGGSYILRGASGEEEKLPQKDDLELVERELELLKRRLELLSKRVAERKEEEKS